MPQQTPWSHFRKIRLTTEEMQAKNSNQAKWRRRTASNPDTQMPCHNQQVSDSAHLVFENNWIT